MSEDTKYSLSAMVERAARCKKSEDDEEAKYRKYAEGRVQAVFDGLLALANDLLAVLRLLDTMHGMQGMRDKLRKAELLEDYVCGACFQSRFRAVYNYGTEFTLHGFVIHPDKNRLRVVGHWRDSTNGHITLGYIPGKSCADDVARCARGLLYMDCGINKSRTEFERFMAVTDNVIAVDIPQYIQKLCKFADENLKNE